MPWLGEGLEAASAIRLREHCVVMRNQPASAEKITQVVDLYGSACCWLVEPSRTGFPRSQCCTTGAQKNQAPGYPWARALVNVVRGSPVRE